MVLVMANPASAGEVNPASSSGAETAWLLASAALVLLTTPGLSFFLRRNGTPKKYCLYHAAELHLHGYSLYILVLFLI